MRLLLGGRYQLHGNYISRIVRTLVGIEHHVLAARPVKVLEVLHAKLQLRRQPVRKCARKMHFPAVEIERERARHLRGHCAVIADIRDWRARVSDGLPVERSPLAARRKGRAIPDCDERIAWSSLARNGEADVLSAVGARILSPLRECVQGLFRVNVFLLFCYWHVCLPAKNEAPWRARVASRSLPRGSACHYEPDRRVSSG